MDHYILDGKETKAVDFETWCAAFDRTNRTVGKDQCGEVLVSTVFLGLDHRFSREGPPILFETMIFGGPHNEWQDRYSTWEQAEAGHNRVVAAVREGRDPEEAATYP